MKMVINVRIVAILFAMSFVNNSYAEEATTPATPPVATETPAADTSATTPTTEAEGATDTATPTPAATSNTTPVTTTTDDATASEEKKETPVTPAMPDASTAEPAKEEPKEESKKEQGPSPEEKYQKEFAEVRDGVKRITDLEDEVQKAFTEFSEKLSQAREIALEMKNSSFAILEQENEQATRELFAKMEEQLKELKAIQTFAEGDF